MSNMMSAHHQWANRPDDQRFQSMDALQGFVESRRKLSQDILISSTAVRMLPSETGDLQMEGSGASLTHWSFGQAAGLGKAPAGFLRELPAPMAASILNHRLQEARRDSVKILVGADPETAEARIRAFLTDRYGRIWDTETVRMVRNVTDGTTWKQPMGYANRRFGAPLVPSGLYASDRDVFIFQIDEDHPIEFRGETLNRGFIVRNSEVGAATFSFQAFLYRKVCGNNIIYGSQLLGEINIKHLGNAMKRAEFLVQPVLQRYVESDTTQERDMLDRAMNSTLGKDEKEISETLRAKGFTKEVTEGAIKRATEEEGGAKSVWAVVNGLTALARDMKHTDERVALERKAGTLLN